MRKLIMNNAQRVLAVLLRAQTPIRSHIITKRSGLKTYTVNAVLSRLYREGRISRHRSVGYVSAYYLTKEQAEVSQALLSTVTPGLPAITLVERLTLLRRIHDQGPFSGNIYLKEIIKEHETALVEAIEDEDEDVRRGVSLEVPSA